MAMMLAERELFNACRVLFGAELNITRDFLEYLQFSGLKTAYRKRALETHPDRAAATGITDQHHHSDLFRQVQSAYENLSTYLDAREKGGIFTPPPSAFTNNFRGAGVKRPTRARTRKTDQQGTHGANTASDFRRQRQHRHKQQQQTNRTKTQGQATWNIDNLFSGAIPERELRLGHFLYYSGSISWRQIIQALVWQRSQRPRLGEIGRRFGWLNEQDILTVLQSRQTPAPFGRTAIILGLLTERQLQTLIWRQKSLQRKIGEFFIETEILATAELQELLLRHQQHNTRVTRTNRFTSSRF